MSRKVADCRELPSEIGCTLTISGEEDEVVRAAVEHAISVHGHVRGPELEAEVRNSLKDEVPAPVAAAGAQPQPQPAQPRPRH